MSNKNIPKKNMKGGGWEVPPQYVTKMNQVLCLGASACNAILGVVLGILVIIYDYLNPYRESDSHQGWFHAISIIWHILLGVNGLSILLHVIVRLINWIASGEMYSDAKGAIDHGADFIKNMLGGGSGHSDKTYDQTGGKSNFFQKLKSYFLDGLLMIVKLLNITLFFTAYLFAKYEPDKVHNIILGYLILFIICLLIIRWIPYALSEWTKWPIFKEMANKLLNLEYILMIEGYMIIILAIFKLFAIGVGTNKALIIKIIFYNILFAMSIGLDGFLLVYDGGCMDI